ncbi:MAG: type II toxin-antitoxin system RelE/ParE family toxin [Planctomycetota bacterium]|jgi:addiction module RelE/StbE family toxin
MAEVRWTPQAADDLDAIAEFISQDSPHYSSLFVLDVLCAVDRLIQFPKSGRVVPEINDPLVRELILGSYRIIYRVRQDLVEILTVFHGSRLLDPSKLN